MNNHEVNTTQNVVVFPYIETGITTTSSRPRSLVDLSINSLQETFGHRGLFPTPEMWTALKAAVQTMSDMADGICPPAYYVSSLDPGVGKTTAMIHFLRELIRSEDHQDVSALICLGRLEQIDKVIQEAGLLDQDFAVLTGKDNIELNALGCGCPEEGRILFTTHAMVEKRCSRGSFAEIKALQFRGQVRQVRIWDEAILPGHTITLRRDNLASLFGVLRSIHPKLTQELEAFFSSLADQQDGSFVTVPDLDVRFDVRPSEIEKLLSFRPEDLRTAGENLWLLMGKRVVVRSDGRHGLTLVSYRETLPADIKPILALDASARVRKTYDLWEKHRGDLVQLPAAPKQYGNLTIHVWDQGGGKSGYRDNGDRIVEGVVKAISSCPNKKWLVVHHKYHPKDRLDLPTEVSARLPPDHRVAFLHWGLHDGTNAFKDVSNIILAGTLFQPKSQLEGLTRLASGIPPSRGVVDSSIVDATGDGENSHGVLQALCRSAVRQMQEEGCPAVDAYLIASARTGIPGLLPEIFPGAWIVPWEPLPRELRGKVAEAVDFVRSWFLNNPEGVLALKDLQRVLGINDSSNFRSTIRHHQDFQASLESMGLEEWGPGQYRKHLRKRLIGFAAAA